MLQMSSMLVTHLSHERLSSVCGFRWGRLTFKLNWRVNIRHLMIFRMHCASENLCGTSIGMPLLSVAWIWTSAQV